MGAEVKLATHNQAELRALEEAIDWVEQNIPNRDLRYDYILVRGDSVLIINFLNKLYVPKNMYLYTHV